LARVGAAGEHLPVRFVLKRCQDLKSPCWMCRRLASRTHTATEPPLPAPPAHTMHRPACQASVHGHRGAGRTCKYERRRPATTHHRQAACTTRQIAITSLMRSISSWAAASFRGGDQADHRHSQPVAQIMPPSQQPLSLMRLSSSCLTAAKPCDQAGGPASSKRQRLCMRVLCSRRRIREQLPADDRAESLRISVRLLQRSVNDHTWRVRPVRSCDRRTSTNWPCA